MKMIVGCLYISIFYFLFSVNYGVLLLRSLLEHWPESHAIPVQEEASPENTTDIGTGSLFSTYRMIRNRPPFVFFFLIVQHLF